MGGPFFISSKYMSCTSKDKFEVRFMFTLIFGNASVTILHSWLVGKSECSDKLALRNNSVCTYFPQLLVHWMACYMALVFLFKIR